jgi:hypothetical protein
VSPHPSSRPSLSASCPPASAPRASQVVFGNGPLRRRRSLARALRLFQRTGAAASALRRPRPPSLPRGARAFGLGTTFAVLPVLRGLPTSAGPSPFVLSVLRATARAEPGRSPRVSVNRRCAHAVAHTPVPTQRISGFAPGGGLTRHGRLTALHSRSTCARTYDSIGRPLAGGSAGRTTFSPPFASARCSGPTPLSRRCRVPCVRAPG